MKAVRVHQFGGPEVLTVEEIPDPVPAEGQIRVRLSAIGVNPVDTYIRSGTYHLKPTLPYTPGGDGAGVVDAVGPNTTGVGVGDRVYVAGSRSGTYAECTVCEDFQVHPLPDRLTFAQGAAVNVPYATAFHGLFHRGGAVPGQTVLVHGATGGVGLAAVQLARACGLTVFGTGGTEAGRNLATEQGAHHMLDHTADGYLDRFLDMTAGKGADVILEMLANVNLARDLSVLARNGCVVVIGNRGTIEINPRDAMQRNASIRGMLLSTVSMEETVRIHAAVGAGLANGSLNPVVGRELPLADAAEAHRRIMEDRAYGKIVLVP